MKITSKSLLRFLAIPALLAIGAPALPAGEVTVEKAPIIEPPPERRIHMLLNFDFSDHYITPRGLNVENKGLVIQPLLLFFTTLHSAPDEFFSDITLTAGVWNSVHTESSPGADPGHWNEIDPIVGLTTKFAKDWKFDIFFTGFISQTDAYDTSTNLSLKFSYDDTKLLGPFALHPYVECFIELSEKATVVFNPKTSEKSFYFSLGMNPGYTFENLGDLRVELPTYINIVGDDFYQKFNGKGGGADLGVFSTMVKLTMPLKFIPKEAGFWSVYGGVQYYYLNNPGLLDGNQVLASAQRDRNLVQFRGGLTIFY